jgi:hypothetical protein
MQSVTGTALPQTLCVRQVQLASGTPRLSPLSPLSLLSLSSLPPLSLLSLSSLSSLSLSLSPLRLPSAPSAKRPHAHRHRAALRERVHNVRRDAHGVGVVRRRRAPCRCGLADAAAAMSGSSSDQSSVSGSVMWRFCSAVAWGRVLAMAWSASRMAGWARVCERLVKWCCAHSYTPLCLLCIDVDDVPWAQSVAARRGVCICAMGWTNLLDKMRPQA